MKQTLGQRIASRRKMMNLSQEALAEQLGISRQSVSKWEADAAVPEIDKLIAMSRIFEVSVGWLLGTEEHVQSADPMSLEVLEEAFYNYRKTLHKKRRLSILVTTVILTLCLLPCLGRLWQLSKELTNAQNRITQLSQSNTDIQDQISQITQMLENREEHEKILKTYGALCYVAEMPDMVQMHFLLYPKIYQENCTAYLNVKNPEINMDALLECTWNRDHYTLRTQLPMEDHYTYTFVLVGNESYEEQNISDPQRYYSDLKSRSQFYIDPDSSKYEQLQSGERTLWDLEKREYTYNIPVYMPRILEKNGLIPFRDVRITLRHNDEIIWDGDYTEQFRKLATPTYRQEIALEPQIAITLPELVSGDSLALELTATTYTDRTLVTTLDELTVVTS